MVTLIEFIKQLEDSTTDKNVKDVLAKVKQKARGQETKAIAKLKKQKNLTPETAIKILKGGL